jgi:hypothetical protein
MFRHAILFVAMVLHSAVIFSDQAHAVSEFSFPDFPFMVHCKFNGTTRAFYLAKISPDGVALYISPDRQAGTITIYGPAKPVGGSSSGSCAGRTILQLRDRGQAFDLR